jgi:hypothetical protein
MRIYCPQADIMVGKMMLGDVNRKLYAWSAKDEIAKAFQRLDEGYRTAS